MLNAQSIKKIFPEVEKSRLGNTANKNFSSELKKEVAEYSFTKSIDDAMEKYGVSKTSVYEWRRDYC